MIGMVSWMHLTRWTVFKTNFCREGCVFEDNYGTYVYTFEYDLMGNRTYMEKTLP